MEGHQRPQDVASAALGEIGPLEDTRRRFFAAIDAQEGEQ